jgi:hypothetical protein
MNEIGRSPGTGLQDRIAEARELVAERRRLSDLRRDFSSPAQEAQEVQVLREVTGWEQLLNLHWGYPHNCLIPDGWAACASLYAVLNALLGPAIRTRPAATASDGAS